MDACDLKMPRQGSNLLPPGSKPGGLCPNELRGHDVNSRLAWTGSDRSTSPMSRGRSAAELQANGCRARIRTWTNRGNNSARYRLTPRGNGGERGIRTLAPAACASLPG